MRRTQLVLTALIASTIAVLPASAGAPTVGGPKAAALAFAFTATGPQQHLLAETAGSAVPMSPDPEQGDTCAAPRCYAFPFNVAGPTKTAKTVEVSSQITWSSPAARFWLQIMDVTTPSAPFSQAACFTFYTSAGPSATVQATLKPSRRYAVWASVEQVAGLTEPVKGVVHAPATDKAPKSPATAADPTGLFLNPCQG